MWDSHNPVSDSKTREAKNKKTKNKPAKFICSHFGFEKKKKIFTKYRDKRSDFFFFLRYKCKLSQQPQTSLRFPAESRREKKKKNAKLNSSKLCLPLGSPFFIIRPPSWAIVFSTNESRKKRKEKKKRGGGTIRNNSTFFCCYFWGFFFFFFYDFGYHFGTRCATASVRLLFWYWLLSFPWLEIINHLVFSFALFILIDSVDDLWTLQWNLKRKKKKKKKKDRLLIIIDRGENWRNAKHKTR